MNLLSQYYVFLDIIPLPVAPEKIEITVPNLNKTVTMVDQGEINILRGKGLKEITFDMLVPSFKYPFANYSFGSISTSQIIARLEYLKEQGEPVYFIVTRCRRGLPAWWTNIRVSVEDFTVTEDANNGTDVIISINLKEYREYSTKFATVEKKEDGTVEAKFSNSRPITGSIAPTFKPSAFVKPEDTTITIEPDNTLYNALKTKLGTTNSEVHNVIKKANAVKNVVTQTTEIKMPPMSALKQYDNLLPLNSAIKYNFNYNFTYSHY